MQDKRNSAEIQRWKREVRQRDGNACRVCEVQRNIHVHHIKPFKKYPDFDTDIDNGITLCGNCHTLFKGKEESTNLQTIIEAVSGQPDRQTANQLKRLNAKFCDYLEFPLTSGNIISGNRSTRNKAVHQLFTHLQIYPNSLNQFLPLIEHLLNEDSETDEGLAKQMAVEFLKSSSSEEALKVLREYEGWIEIDKQRREAKAEELRQLRLRAEQGNAEAQTYLGLIYESHMGMGEEYGVERDYGEAGKWFRKAAQQGDADAQAYLGEMYRYGRGGVDKDYKEAVKWFCKAAQGGSELAENNLGEMYADSWAVNKDYRETIKWFRKAAQQGNTTAQYNLGRWYAVGEDVPQNDVEAVKWFRKAAENGYPAAQNDLGWMYQNGRGIPQGDAEAIKWFRKAAQQGYAIAQDNLGWMYQNGRGVPQNDAEAIKWFRKAAEGGNLAKSQDNLGWMYQHGRGVSQDDAEAIKWFRKAAEGGYSAAQDNLSWMYQNGRGVEQI